MLKTGEQLRRRYTMVAGIEGSGHHLIMALAKSLSLWDRVPKQWGRQFVMTNFDPDFFLGKHVPLYNVSKMAHRLPAACAVKSWHTRKAMHRKAATSDKAANAQEARGACVCVCVCMYIRLSLSHTHTLFPFPPYLSLSFSLFLRVNRAPPPPFTLCMD